MNILPTYLVDSVGHIDVDRLIADRPHLKVISYDLDKTLTTHNARRLPKEHLILIETVASRGIKQTIISNAEIPVRVERVKEVVNITKEETGVSLGVTTSYEVGVIKPHRLIFETALAKLGASEREACHIGDQWSKDVVGANFAGYDSTILVAPFGGRERESKGTRYIQRPLEAIARPIFGMPFRSHKFPSTLKPVKREQ